MERTDLTDYKNHTQTAHGSMPKKAIISNLLFEASITLIPNPDKNTGEGGGGIIGQYP